MSEKFIPEYIDPFRYAEQSLKLSGQVNITDLHRIGNNLNKIEGNIHVDLQFGIDEQKIANIAGHLEAKLTLECQRCMGPFVYEIMSDFTLGVVNTLEEANALPANYEPVIASEGQLALREVVEDELILSLPIIPRHEPDTCQVKSPMPDMGWKEDKVESPFRVLEGLKKREK